MASVFDSSPLWLRSELDRFRLFDLYFEFFKINSRKLWYWMIGKNSNLTWAGVIAAAIWASCHFSNWNISKFKQKFLNEVWSGQFYSSLEVRFLAFSLASLSCKISCFSLSISARCARTTFCSSINLFRQNSTLLTSGFTSSESTSLNLKQNFC